MQVVPRPATDAECRVGVDLAVVADVAGAVGWHGDRYLQRVYTAHELASCRTGEAVRFESLAARFAAKEAVVKLLQPLDLRPPWQDIEVRRAPNGACSIRLYGAAERLATEQGVGQISLSLSHDGGVAVAVAVALCRAGADHAAGARGAGARVTEVRG